MHKILHAAQHKICSIKYGDILLIKIVDFLLCTFIKIKY